VHAPKSGLGSTTSIRLRFDRLVAYSTNQLPLNMAALPVVLNVSHFYGEILKVPTRNDTARLEFRVPRPANEDVGTSILRLQNLIERDARVLNVSAIGIDTLEADKYTLAAQVWTQRGSVIQLKYDLNRSIKEEFDRTAVHVPDGEYGLALDVEGGGLPL